MRVPAVVALAITMSVFAGCDEEPTGRTLPVPTLRLPTVATPGTAPAPGGDWSPQTQSLRVRYPLTLAEAQGYAGLGYVVAGWFPAGEVTVRKTTLTETETKPVEEQVCDYEWDYTERKSVYKCKYKTVYRPRQVLRTKFYVAGPGMPTVTYDTVNQAFARIAPTDYWRRMG